MTDRLNVPIPPAVLDLLDAEYAEFCAKLPTMDDAELLMELAVELDEDSRHGRAALMEVTRRLQAK